MHTQTCTLPSTWAILPPSTGRGSLSSKLCLSKVFPLYFKLPLPGVAAPFLFVNACFVRSRAPHWRGEADLITASPSRAFCSQDAVVLCVRACVCVRGCVCLFSPLAAELKLRKAQETGSILLPSKGMFILQSFLDLNPSTQKCSCDTGPVPSLVYFTMPPQFARIYGAAHFLFPASPQLLEWENNPPTHFGKQPLKYGSSRCSLRAFVYKCKMVDSERRFDSRGEIPCTLAAWGFSREEVSMGFCLWIKARCFLWTGSGSAWGSSGIPLESRVAHYPVWLDAATVITFPATWCEETSGARPLQPLGADRRSFTV